MGYGAMDSRDVRAYYTTHSHISSSTNASQVFREREFRDEFNPAKIKLPRESCDSSFNPHSRGIIFAEDLTGSMDSFLHSLIKEEFPRLIKQTYDIVSYNPHIMFMGVGDVAEGDSAPLQVTQFEADVRMLDQLQKIYVERGGGCNYYESYILPWYFAGKHIEMDCWNKRKEKGFLFTFGDENPTPKLTHFDIKKVFGDNDTLNESFISAEDCLELASEKFNCYHIILPGSYYNAHPAEVLSNWRDLMGSHVCNLNDHQYLPELISTILKMYEGISKTDAINCIQDDCARQIVKHALESHEENINEQSNNGDTPNIDVF